MDRLQSMRAFAEVAKRGSFTAAADHLDMSRVKTTRYVSALEEWLGARLLHRSTRRISLTEAGKVHLRQCELMLELEEEIQATSGAQETVPSGQLRITTSTSFGQAHLANAVVDYLTQYPEVSIDLMMVDRTVNLIEERVDLAIRIAGELDPGLVARRIAPCHSVVCASPAYLDTHGKPQSPEDLSQHNCLCYSHYGKGLWRFSRSNDGEIAVPVTGNLKTNEISVLTQAALSGAGITLQPTYLAGPLIRSGQLVRLLPDWSPSTLYIWGVYLSRQHMPTSLRALLDFLVERYQGTPDWDLGFNY